MNPITKQYKDIAVSRIGGARGIREGTGQMPTITESTEVNRSADKVFAYTTDPANWPAWQPFPTAEQTSPGPMGVGTTTAGTLRLKGLTMKWTAVVTEFDPVARFGKRAEAGPITLDQHNVYEPLDGGTRLTIRYDMTLAAALKPLSPILVRIVRTALREALRKLAHNLETSL